MLFCINGDLLAWHPGFVKFRDFGLSTVINYMYYYSSCISNNSYCTLNVFRRKVVIFYNIPGASVIIKTLRIVALI